MATEKSHAPAYVSPKSLFTFFNARREDGHVTDVVDKSLMSNFSGSTVNELVSSLKFLGLISAKGEPSDTYRAFVLADDEKRKALMADILRAAYPFLWNTPGFNLERATTQQMIDVFRAQGANGSTMVRGIAFFLTQAKYAGIPVSPNIKAPNSMRTAPRPKKDSSKAPAAAPAADPQDDDDDDDDAFVPGKVMKVHIPIPIGRRVTVIVPHPWTGKDWAKFKAMLDLYTEDWDQQQSLLPIQKDKGPTPETE